MLYRVIIEMSFMVNNDEYVFFTQELVNEENVSRFVPKYRYGGPPEANLVLCRPVDPTEVKQGLDTMYRGHIADEKTPKLTLLIDAAQRILDEYAHKQRYSDLYQPPAESIAKKHVSADWRHNAILSYVAYNFYDCMSGGVSKYTLALCRSIIERLDVDLSLHVYPMSESAARERGLEPSGDDWYTVADFLEEIKDVERLEKMLPGSVLNLLPAK